MQYKLFTDKGTRELNEDYIGMTSRDGRYLFVLADGLGGHGRGEAASRLVIEEIVQYYMKQTVIPDISECIDYAQEQLLTKQEQEHDKNGMKTTLALLEIADGQARWAHVGDSRLYCFNRNKVTVRTLDHSVPQMLVSSGEIKEKNIRGHEDRNRLLRVMGIEWSRPMYEISSWVPLRKCQAFLLCSDGFWELLEEKYMERLLKRAVSPEQWVNEMTKIICDNGTGKDMDNFSAIAVFVDAKGEA